MPLNRQSVLADIRATNPELYDNWDDDLILGTGSLSIVAEIIEKLKGVSSERYLI